MISAINCAALGREWLLRKQSLCALIYRGAAYELKPKGVRVTVLCPGPVPTEFQARAGITGDVFPRLRTRSAERVARDGYRGFKKGRRVVVPGSINKTVGTLVPFAPRGLLLPLVARRREWRRQSFRD
jgi:uncharacterized protein